MASSHCKTLDAKSAKQLIASVDTILCDSDGVLWKGDKLVDGGPSTIEKLKTMGKRVLFVTNNSSKSRRESVVKFLEKGYHVVDSDVFCSSYTTAQYLKTKLHPRDKVFCIGMDGLVEELELAGITTVDRAVSSFERDWTVRDLDRMRLDDDVRCVVVGLDLNFTFAKATRAAKYLQDRNCMFVATSLDPNLPTQSGHRIPSTGAIVSMIQTACQRRPEVFCGKPHQVMYDVIASNVKLDRRRTLFIGDRVETDILFAGRAGFQSLLVLTGVSTLSDVYCKQKSLQDDDLRAVPNFYLPSLGELGRLIV